MNSRQYNEVKRPVKWMSHNTMVLCLPHCIVWYSFYCSVYPIVLCDIHFTALFTSLYCLTLLLLLCLPHCIVCYSFYCSVYPLYYLTLLLLLWNECQTIQWGKQSSKSNVIQYNEANRAVKWMSDNTMR
jgi:hypothetical protein